MYFISLPFITVGEKLAEFIILRFWNQREIHYFDLFERLVFPLTHMLSTRTLLPARHTHMFAFSLCCSPGLWVLRYKCACAKMTCVELLVGVQPAMKLESWSKVASLHMLSCGILTCGKETRRWAPGDKFVGHYGVFALQLNVFIVTFSRALKFNFTDIRPKHSKCARSVFSQRVRFSRAPAPTISKDRERRRHERRKIGDFMGILRQIYLKMPLEGSLFSNHGKYTFHYFDISINSHNAFFWDLHTAGEFIMNIH